MSNSIDDTISRRGFLKVAGITSACSLTGIDSALFASGSLPEPIMQFRKVVHSRDVETYSKAALDLRKWHTKNDPYRPLYHFTGPESWINDPNGVIYHKGKYHLFYQFDPNVMDREGNLTRSQRCWGHAVSDDLVHWEDWPVAIWPDSPFDIKGVYSGNCFIHDGKIHALYTGNINARNEAYGMLAWTDDDGVTFKKKMVMHNNQRPNRHSPVHWDAQVWKEGDTWCQLVGGTNKDKTQGTAMLWKSKDLHNWEFIKNIAPSIKHSWYWELPYLVELNGKHVLMVGAGHVRMVGAGNPYWIGTYDKKEMEFKAESPMYQVDTGNYYSFNPHMIDNKGAFGSQRRIMHGWATIGRPPAVKDVPYWESAHTIPRVISVKDNRLWQEAIPELKSLRRSHKKIGKKTLSAGNPVHLKSIRGDALEIKVRFDRKTATQVGIVVRANAQAKGTRVWADSGSRFGIEGSANSNFLNAGDSVELNIFVDRGILEVYCNGVAVTHKCFAPADQVEVFAYCEGSDAELEKLNAWKMNSMWD